MKSKYILSALLLSAGIAAQAQDVYKFEALSGSDLTGTARYVGMGGAMNALGADLSTMGTNPAAIGLYRKSDAAITASITSQPDGINLYDLKKTRASFDQLGFVYACRIGDETVRFMNFGFNYQKRRNFKNTLSTGGNLDGGLSQSWQIADIAARDNLLYDGGDQGWLTQQSYDVCPLGYAGYQSYLVDAEESADGKSVNYLPSEASRYNYRRAQWGGIHEFDFNVSFNFKDRFYAGLTVGCYDVSLKSGVVYGENIIGYDNGNRVDIGPYLMNSEEKLSGNGVDVKLGFILRPIESNPFRIGFSVSTPTFYNLTQSNYLQMTSPWYDDGSATAYTEYEQDVIPIDYKLRTPWRINLSAATTIENILALDLEYEYANYSSTNVRYNTYDYYSSWDNGTRDYALDTEADECLKGVHTFKVGAEAKIAKGLFLRAGYNYVSAPHKQDAFLNLFTNSPSYLAATYTDYVNLGELHRGTFGLGYRGKHFYADAAYQYQTQKGDFYPFHYSSEGTITNDLAATSVNFKRNNVILTIGYKF